MSFFPPLSTILTLLPVMSSIFVSFSLRAFASSLLLVCGMNRTDLMLFFLMFLVFLFTLFLVLLFFVVSVSTFSSLILFFSSFFPAVWRRITLLYVATEILSLMQTHACFCSSVHLPQSVLSLILRKVGILAISR